MSLDKEDVSTHLEELFLQTEPVLNEEDLYLLSFF